MSDKIKSFEDLEIWQMAHSLVLDIYNLVKNFPQKEIYILVPQLTRAAISISTNIAEGMGRYSKNEFIQFLIISRGSIEEIKSLLILSRDLSYIDNDKFIALKDKYSLLGKKINTLINSIKNK